MHSILSLQLSKLLLQGSLIARFRMRLKLKIAH